jgi:aminobenzoyl-glutamate utilization protein B
MIKRPLFTVFINPLYDNNMRSSLFLFLMAAISPALFPAATAQTDSDKAFVIRQIENDHKVYCQIAKDIWGYAELGYQETQSAQALMDYLREREFEVESGVADIPTAFVATYGRGKPVIGILAEYDALPGLSQDTTPYRKPLVEGGSGHGCGHNLFGTASMAAGVALKEWLKAGRMPGTIIVYGTPAEEGGGGKVYMARAGLFDQADAILHWHPSDRNNADAASCLAAISGVFRFHGETAHAAMSPHRGRSALDGVEALNFMTNLMREHVEEKTRIHYVIKQGGMASNVVPDYAEAEYTVRHPDIAEARAILGRIIKAAEGAAMGTETRMEFELVNAIYGLLPNKTLARAMHANLEAIGGIVYEERELAWAAQLQVSFAGRRAPPLSQAERVDPFQMGYFPASTDVGDVSYIAPTAGLGTATWVPGTAPHTWQAVAADGMSIGFKGMILAAKVLAATGVDLLTTPELIAKAQAEFKERMRERRYEPLIGDRPPPLDYRRGY